MLSDRAQLGFGLKARLAGSQTDFARVDLPLPDVVDDALADIVFSVQISLISTILSLPIRADTWSSVKLVTKFARVALVVGQDF